MAADSRQPIRLVTDRPMEVVEVHPPSPAWLGGDCPHPAVRGSGMWNVDHVGESYGGPAFLDGFEALVESDPGTLRA